MRVLSKDRLKRSVRTPGCEFIFVTSTELSWGRVWSAKVGKAMKEGYYEFLHRNLTGFVDLFHEFQDVVCECVDYGDTDVIVVGVLREKGEKHCDRVLR